jgi:DNA repair protein RadD
VRGRKLVTQASNRLHREDVPHAIRMAGHKFDDNHIQICSIDTLISRKIKPNAQLIIIDEAHLASSAGYKEFLSFYEQAFVLSVTATPYNRNGLGHLAEEIVHPVTVRELIKQGHLVRPRYYSAYVPDLKKVKVRQGDYVQDELAKRVNQTVILSNVVNTWKKLGEDKPTLCFAVNIDHSKSLIESFQKMGVPAAHMDAETPDTERDALIKNLEEGKIKVICNVGILTTGVDIPCVQNIILARPTKSYNLYIQMIGRGTRPYDGKDHFKILDHSGSVLDHGFIEEEPAPSLKDNRTINRAPPAYKTCRNCYCVFVGTNCHSCGTEAPVVTKLIQEVDGELEEITEIPKVDIKKEFQRLYYIAKQKNYKLGWVYHILKSKFGEDEAQKCIREMSSSLLGTS